MLVKFFSDPDAQRLNGEFVDGEQIEILYYGYDQFTLLDENKDVVDIVILQTE